MLKTTKTKNQPVRTEAWASVSHINKTGIYNESSREYWKIFKYVSDQDQADVLHTLWAVWRMD